MKITLGTDPEFFLVDTRRSSTNKFVSAHDLIPGTKTEPYKMKSGMLQVDGLSVEFNTKPASSGKEFAENVMEALTEIRSMIDRRYAFSFTPAIRFDKEYFHALPEKVRELGCSPDFSAHSGSVLPTPKRKKEDTLCTGSGHLHVGWTDKADITDVAHFNDALVVARAMFNVIGNVRFIWDNDKDRASLYGVEGAFRPKPYGVESRFLSNAWLKYPKLWPWLFDMTQAVVDKLETKGSVPAPWATFNLSDMNRELNYLGYPNLPTDFQKSSLVL